MCVRGPAVPSVVVGSVRAMDNKMYELEVLTGSWREFRECGAGCFAKMWLHDGFLAVRGDRDYRGNGQPVMKDTVWASGRHGQYLSSTAQHYAEAQTVQLCPGLIFIVVL